MINTLYNSNLNEIINEIINEITIKINIKYIIILLLFFVVVSMLLFIIISYFIIKFLKLSIDDNNILFYRYNNKSKKILDLYGDCKITNIYLIREPLHKINTFIINIFTLYNYEKLIHESQDNFPYHCLMIFEVKLKNNMKKMLYIDKNSCINIRDNFLIHNTQEFKKLNIKNKHLTINTILNTTQARLGNEQYFNWHLYKNNCQKFIKELLKTIGKYNKINKNFIFRDKLFNIIIPSEFTLHIVNCVCVVCNITEKYIYDNKLFY